MTPVFLGAEIVKTLLMQLFVRAVARLVALRIAVVLRLAFVDTTAVEKGNSIHRRFHWEQGSRKSCYCSSLKEVNEASCTNFILNMMQHFTLNLDATISISAVSGQFLFQLVFVSNSPPPPQGTQDRRSGPCFSELPRWL